MACIFFLGVYMTLQDVQDVGTLSCVNLEFPELSQRQNQEFTATRNRRQRQMQELQPQLLQMQEILGSRGWQLYSIAPEFVGGKRRFLLTECEGQMFFSHISGHKIPAAQTRG